MEAASGDAQLGKPRSHLTVGDLAHARSGDKGNHANIGVVAYSAEGYEILKRELTAERVAQFFHALGADRVERFELPNIWALNFLLYNALAGGASQSLRIDTQGKLLGTAILALEIDNQKPSVVSGEQR